MNMPGRLYLTLRKYEAEVKYLGTGPATLPWLEIISFPS